MKTKLIITESQYEKVKTFLTENTMHARMVKEMKDFLDSNYTPTENYVREGGEYFGKESVRVLVVDFFGAVLSTSFCHSSANCF
jgi:hypothetical protein